MTPDIESCQSEFKHALAYVSGKDAAAIQNAIERTRKTLLDKAFEERQRKDKAITLGEVKKKNLDEHLQLSESIYEATCKNIEFAYILTLSNEGVDLTPPRRPSIPSLPRLEVPVLACDNCIYARSKISHKNISFVVKSYLLLSVGVLAVSLMNEGASIGLFLAAPVLALKLIFFDIPAKFITVFADEEWFSIEWVFPTVAVALYLGFIIYLLFWQVIPGIRFELGRNKAIKQRADAIKGNLKQIEASKEEIMELSLEYIVEKDVVPVGVCCDICTDFQGKFYSSEYGELESEYFVRQDEEGYNK